MHELLLLYIYQSKQLDLCYSYNTRLYCSGRHRGSLEYATWTESQLRDWVIVASVIASRALGIVALL